MDACMRYSSTYSLMLKKDMRRSLMRKATSLLGLIQTD